MREERLRGANPPISPNGSVWRHDAFLKSLFRAEDRGWEDAAEDLFLSVKHTTLRMLGGPWRLLLPPGVCHRDNSSFTLGFSSRGSPKPACGFSILMWAGRSRPQWSRGCPKRWAGTDKMSTLFPLHTPSSCSSQNQSLHKHEGEGEREKSMRVRQTWLSYPEKKRKRISALIGCGVTFRLRLCKKREALYDSSPWNKTSNYSYSIRRRIKRVNAADTTLR